MFVTPEIVEAVPGGPVRGHLLARNVGTSVWLPSDAPLGPVLVGAHLNDANGILIDQDYARFRLPSLLGGAVAPGDDVEVDVEIVAPDEPGEYTLELDLVAEHVAWFSVNESRTASIRLLVR